MLRYFYYFYMFIIFTCSTQGNQATGNPYEEESLSTPEIIIKSPSQADEFDTFIDAFIDTVLDELNGDNQSLYRYAQLYMRIHRLIEFCYESRNENIQYYNHKFFRLSQYVFLIAEKMILNFEKNSEHLESADAKNAIVEIRKGAFISLKGFINSLWDEPLMHEESILMMVDFLANNFTRLTNLFDDERQKELEKALEYSSTKLENEEARIILNDLLKKL